jgi:hypothetical protein
MTRQEWQSPKFRAEYERKRYAKHRKEGVSLKIRYGVYAERMYCPAVIRQGVRHMSYW